MSAPDRAMTASGGTPPAGQPAVAPSQPRRRRSWITEVVVILAIAVIIAVVLRTFVIQTFIIPSGSMEPTLLIGDRIVVDKLSYHLHAVGRGDIIVFATPPAENGRCSGPPVPDLVKRVIGLPGERISSQGNTVLINGKPLAEPWLPKNEPLGEPITPTTVKANHYFVMGDNRPDSCDSRVWGQVPASSIVGRVVAVFWPLSRIHFF